MNKLNEQGQKHGYWESYFPSGVLLFKGNYINGRIHGYWENYHSNGILFYKGNYINDREHGYLEWVEQYEFILI